MHTLVRVTTVPVSLQYLLKGQLKFMKKNGFNVLAASANGLEVKAVEQEEECIHYSFPLTRKINPLLDIFCIIKMVLFFNKVKPTIVHSHTPKAGFVAMIAAKICAVPIRVHSVAGLPWMESKGIKKIVLKNIEKLIVFAATKVYINSKNLYTFLEKNKFNTSKLSMIGKGSSNGINEKYFSINNEINEKATSLKRTFDANDNTWIWLFVGRIVTDKGIIELIDAFYKITNHFPNDKLWLVGNPEPEFDPLSKDCLDKINENKNIVQFGFQQDVRPFYAASNMLVFPSYREGFPNVPMQAALMDCGLILSNINGCNEIVEHGKNGLLVEAKNTNDLYEKMLFARNNKNIIDDFKKEAKSHVISNYNQATVWSNILHEYKQLLNQYAV